MAHRFQFFRTGGVDQVSLRDGDDMLALGELDKKLWVALAMPSVGVAIEPETLALLDADGDGRIRVHDILETIEWAKRTFKKPGELLESKSEIELAMIADPKIVVGAKRILADLGKHDATSISVDDAAASTKAFAETLLNGDGVVIPASAKDGEVRHAIEDAIACVGSVADRTGKPGIDQALANAFFAEVDMRWAWLSKAKDATALLGARSATATAAFVEVSPKIEDFFTRCKLAAFDSRGSTALAGQEATLVALGERTLSERDEALARLPLAKLDTKGRLPLNGTVNPAWASRIQTFVTNVVTPILGAREQLTLADYDAIVGKLTPYRAWLDAKPTTKVDALPEDWLAKLAGPEVRERLAKLIASDVALAGEYEQINAVTKAVRVRRDFGRILRNFVNFSDFYSRQDGIFQAGTLYLDARALHLCMVVTDPAKHGALAAASDSCLLYCDITRGSEKKQIVAALTNGDVDNVFVGRNGVFYDREGRDWDATVARIVNNPVSVRAAFWSPYKKVVRMIEMTVARRAQAAEDKSTAVMESVGTEVGTADKRLVAEAARPAPGTQATSRAGRIDLGTIAAIGVAIGGIGTLVAALLANLFGLGRWLPLGIVALMLMISGPSMLLAWLKLRRRNLGPILDASGWAINSRARINVAFGAVMTELAQLPPGAKRHLDDPFADKRTPWRRYVLLILVLGLFGLWYVGKLDRYLPDEVDSVNVLGDLAPKR